MPEGKDVTKALYRVLRKREMRERITIGNRLMPVRVLTSGGRAVGAAALRTRTGGFVEIAAKTAILATGPCGRLGLPASGYLYGSYENPTNAGDKYSMAYHAGAELSGIECFQINPLIKDYNGPACADVANPFGGYQVNAAGERFVESDYWSGDMMAEVTREIESARGPIHLKVSHLPDETLGALESILHTTERPTRDRARPGRGESPSDRPCADRTRDSVAAYRRTTRTHRTPCPRRRAISARRRRNRAAGRDRRVDREHAGGIRRRTRRRTRGRGSLGAHRCCTVFGSSSSSSSRPNRSSRP